jgi:hypothetical protein
MPTFTITHEINCDVDTFWRIFFQREFNDAVYKQALGFPQFEMLELRETPTGMYRKCKGQPKLDMPGPVMKVLGSSFGYTEEGNLDRAKNTWTWKMTPSTLADKLRQEGKFTITPHGEGKVRRVTELTNEAKIFGIGGLIESAGEKQLRAGWDTSARFMNEWIRDGKAPPA